MFEPVYVVQGSKDSGISGMVYVIPASMGIVKLKGCQWFVPAVKRDGLYARGIIHCDYPGVKLYCDSYGSVPDLAICRERYASIPEPGTAWLVEEGTKYINWTRIDLNLHLLNEDGSICKGDH